LARIAKTVIHENTGSNSGAAGGTFSKATFSAKAGPNTPGKEVDIDDPDFWKKMIGEVQAEDENNAILNKKRKRKQAIYNENHLNAIYDNQIEMSEDDDENYRSDSSFDSNDEEIVNNEECEFNLNSELIP